MIGAPDTAQMRRCLRVVAMSCLIGALVVACSLDWDVVPSPPSTEEEAGAHVSASHDSSIESRIEAGSDARVEIVHDAGVDADAALDSGADAIADAGDDADATIECSKTAPCSSGAYCRYPDRLCGTGAPGVCVAEPKNCGDASLAVVCGCDGVTHTSSCAAAAAGTDVSQNGCALPPGTFACGDHVCVDGDYCAVSGSGSNATYECRSGASCTLCLCALACLGGTCGTENGHLVTRCP